MTSTCARRRERRGPAHGRIIALGPLPTPLSVPRQGHGQALPSTLSQRVAARDRDRCGDRTQRVRRDVRARPVRQALGACLTPWRRLGCTAGDPPVCDLPAAADCLLGFMTPTLQAPTIVPAGRAYSVNSAWPSSPEGRLSILRICAASRSVKRRSSGRRAARPPLGERRSRRAPAAAKLVRLLRSARDQ